MEAGRVFGIAFIDRDSGWAVGGPWPAVEGFLFHTTDCGSTWTRRVISYRAAVRIRTTGSIAPLLLSAKAERIGQPCTSKCSNLILEIPVKEEEQ
jgi:hypothetical protein